MKKFIVSSVVIVGFVAYSIYQRLFGIQTAPLTLHKNTGILPSGTSQPVSPSPTNTPTSVPLPSQSNVKQAPPTNTPSPTAKPVSTSGYKDGAYTGDAADAFYGNIQIQATISNGKITNIQFLQAPNDRGTSIEINSQADPMLAQEAIQAQSANVDVVSGATDSSNAFVQSLQSALDKAKS